MKILLTIFFFLASFSSVLCQEKLYTKDGLASFYSKAPIEDIEAHNKKLLSVWNTATGQIEFSVLMKGFEFEKALMQEHFNENYVESDKFPKAVFKGTIKEPVQSMLTRDGTFNVTVSGNLTLHGITRQLAVPATITVKNNTISATSTFSIALADYNIKIPGIVRRNISNNILIKIIIPSYQPLGR
jgi:hypothetical protein